MSSFVKVPDSGSEKTTPKTGNERTKKLLIILLIVLFVLIGGCTAFCSGNRSGSDNASSSSEEISHKGKLQAPISSYMAEDENYEDVQTQFEKAGFTNVKAVPEGDLVLSVMHHEGDVDTISIDGDTSYNSDDWFEPDAKVVIRYHSEHSSNDSDASNSADTSKSSGQSSSTDTSKTSAKNSEGVDANVKAFGDSYEKFVDEYVAFMKKYNSASSTDQAAMLNDYSSLMQKYSDFMDKADKYNEEESNWNSATQKYWTDLYTRCSQKILDAAE